MNSTILLFMAGATLLGQNEASKNSKAETKQSAAASAKALEDFKTDASAYVIRLASRPREKLTLHEESLFHWGNPARNGEDGAVFVWLLDGRPEVIGSVFTYRFRDVIRRKHEYHSLADGPLQGESHDRPAAAPSCKRRGRRSVLDISPPNVPFGARTARRVG